ncbi:tensin-3-like [Tubulanus polymorphus]|uniref:tensin-3-like n=1 Tax=Tubulanus polymorphus TaxID=672921 RepID=UPI003DA61BE5
MPSSMNLCGCVGKPPVVSAPVTVPSKPILHTNNYNTSSSSVKKCQISKPANSVKFAFAGEKSFYGACSPQKYKVTQPCVPPTNYELQSHGGINSKQPLPQTQPPLHPHQHHHQQQHHHHHRSNHVHVTKSQPLPSSQPPQPSMATRKYHSTKRMDDEQFEVDLTYVTKRIIAMTFPVSEGHEVSYRNSMKEVTAMLKTKHGTHYFIVNLSENHFDLSRSNGNLSEQGWPATLAPPLERLCSICKSIDSWLNSDPNHVIVLHCKGGTSRVAVILEAYMHYSNICASADKALDRFAMKRFYDEKDGMKHPSQKRYVNYFGGLLSGALKVNSKPLYLHNIVLQGIPNFDGKGGCKPFIKIYQGLQPIFTSGVYNVTENMQRVCFVIEPGLLLHGDILIKCYHKRSHRATRDVIFRSQFHTCAISDYTLAFKKMDLDDSCTDERFPDHGRVEVVFSSSPHKTYGKFVFYVSVNDLLNDSGVLIDDAMDPLVRWDSYEKFNSHPQNTAEENGDIMNSFSTSSATTSHHKKIIRTTTQQTQQQHVEHTSGPDGSLYAKVHKKKDGTMHNGSNDVLHNSMDSGISSTSGVTGVSVSLSTSTSGANQSVTYSQTSTMKSDEQSELDAILADLLGGQTLISTVPITSTADSESKSYSYNTSSKKTVPQSETVHQTYSFSENRTQSGRPLSPQHFSMERTFQRVAKDDLDAGKLSTLPYRIECSGDDDPFVSEHVLPRSYSSGDTTLSWLHQQQQKLRYRRDSERTDQEKQLVQELKNAQTRLITKREMNEAEERAVFDHYSPAFEPSPNEGISTYSRVEKRYETQGSPFRSSPGPYSITYTTAGHGSNPNLSIDSQVHHQPTVTTDSYATVIVGGLGQTSKPPPSPAQQQQQQLQQQQQYVQQTTHTSAPTSPVAPVRGSSSRDAVLRTRSNTVRNEWQSHSRPLQRQRSDTSFDRDRPVSFRSSRHSSPSRSPQNSPRSQSPTSYYTSYFYTYREPPVHAPAAVDFSFTVPTTKAEFSGVSCFTQSKSNTSLSDKSQVEKRSAFENYRDIQSSSHTSRNYLYDSTTLPSQKTNYFDSYNQKSTDSFSKPVYGDPLSLYESKPKESLYSYKTTSTQQTQVTPSQPYRREPSPPSFDYTSLVKKVKPPVEEPVPITVNKGLSPAAKTPTILPKTLLYDMQTQTTEMANEETQTDTAVKPRADELSSPISDTSSFSEDLDKAIRQLEQMHDSATEMQSSLRQGLRPPKQPDRKIDSPNYPKKPVQNKQQDSPVLDYLPKQKTVDPISDLKQTVPATSQYRHVYSNARHPVITNQTNINTWNTDHKSNIMHYHFNDPHQTGTPRHSNNNEPIQKDPSIEKETVPAKKAPDTEDASIPDNQQPMKNSSNVGDENANIDKPQPDPVVEGSIVPRHVEYRNVNGKLLNKVLKLWKNGVTGDVQKESPKNPNDVKSNDTEPSDHDPSESSSTDENVPSSNQEPIDNDPVNDDSDCIIPVRDDKTEGFGSKLEELERSLKAAENAIAAQSSSVHTNYAYQKPAPEPKPISEPSVPVPAEPPRAAPAPDPPQPQPVHHQTFSTTSTTTHNTYVKEQIPGFPKQQVAPEDDDIITLRPVGVHNLESDTIDAARPGTPGRLSSPGATPPFPVTPYQNQATMLRFGSSATSSLNSLPDNSQFFCSGYSDIDPLYASIPDELARSRRSVSPSVNNEKDTATIVRATVHTLEHHHPHEYHGQTQPAQYQSATLPAQRFYTPPPSGAVFNKSENQNIQYSSATLPPQRYHTPPPGQFQQNETQHFQYSSSTMPPQRQQSLPPMGGQFQQTDPNIQYSSVPQQPQRYYTPPPSGQIQQTEIQNQNVQYTSKTLPHQRFYTPPPSGQIQQVPQQQVQNFQYSSATLPAQRTQQHREEYKTQFQYSTTTNPPARSISQTLPQDVILVESHPNLNSQQQQQNQQFIQQQQEQQNLIQQQQNQQHLIQQQQNQQHLIQQQQNQQHMIQQQSQLQQQQLQQQQQQQHQQQQSQQHVSGSYIQSGSATLPPPALRRGESMSSQTHVEQSSSVSQTLPRSQPDIHVHGPASPAQINQLKQQLSSESHLLSTHPAGQSSPSVYTGLSRGGSMTSLAASDIGVEFVHHTPKFVKDTSKYWYKPAISREEAINLLKDKAPGTFVVRDSNSFPGAFGLALKVDQVPANIASKPNSDPSSELVRHFLIESTAKGVRLKGCANEPVFGSLAALVYQHSITPLALPMKLVLPEIEVLEDSNLQMELPGSAEALLTQGAACNVVYLNSIDTELLTGPQAIARAMEETLKMDSTPKTTEVHFKVSSQGITLTDNQRKLFFRRHYPVSTVTYAGMDPADRRWTGSQMNAKVFGFVARKQGSPTDNTCHIFAELDPEQPASAIVNFITKVMIGSVSSKS